MNKTPQTLKGFRDFLPAEKKKRDWVQKKITEVFDRFGFEPLETPTLEYADLLLGKYGDEADKLVYTFEDKGGRRVGLRYDQTVPTARVLGQYQNELPKYFRRYQIQNVFRADKPQKGRYREFTQCDIDIFGSTSSLSDAEILACTYQAFKNIGFTNITIKLNFRPNLIATIKPFITEAVSEFSIIQTIDKLGKLSTDAIVSELVSKGLSPDQAQAVLPTVTNQNIPSEIEVVTQQAQQLGVNSITFDPTLARGLDYYTGMIFEVIIPEFTVGSVGGGGRYDNLINDLTGTNIPAVGMAFGFDRTVEAAEELGLIPTDQSSTQVLVTIFNQTQASLIAAKDLRLAGINTELYPAQDKLDKQLKYANKAGIPWVIVIGDQEAAENKVALKNMATGDQQTLSIDEAISQLRTG